MPSPATSSSSVESRAGTVGAGWAFWDTAAGVILVKEAGGFLTDYRGSDRSFERRQYLAANGELHSKLHKLVAGALR